MIYKALRYLSASILIYLSIIGARHTFFDDLRPGPLTAILIYLPSCIVPFMILFFGVGASEVDIPRKTGLDDSDKRRL